jgi:hypothetical protein
LIETFAQKKTFDVINQLMNFYELSVYSNHENDNDTTQIIFRKNNVDEYMNTLLRTWNIDWQRILKLEKKNMIDETQQLTLKWTDDIIDENEHKIKKQRMKNACWLR